MFLFVSCSADSIRNLPADEGVLASEPQRPPTGVAPQEIVAETGRPRSVVEFSPGFLKLNVGADATAAAADAADALS
jgi:hypothetical protein